MDMGNMDMDMGARCGAEVARWPHDLRAVADSAAMRGVSVIGRPVGAVCKLHMTRESAAPSRPFPDSGHGSSRGPFGQRHRHAWPWAS